MLCQPAKTKQVISTDLVIQVYGLTRQEIQFTVLYVYIKKCSIGYKKTSPKVVKPGSILARLERVLTTSPLFIYSCKQRSIRF